MRAYDLRTRIRQDFLLGTVISLNSPGLVESIATAGFDFLCLDAEHSALHLGDVESLIRAADVSDMPSVVRVPEVGPMIGGVLDLGAAGIIVPRVESVAQAQDVVERSRFPPDGKRGAGASRCANYGRSLADHVARANGEILVLVQIETVAGLEAMDRIAAVPGIYGLVIGPFDLSMSLGEPVGSAAHEKAVQAIISTALSHGIAAAAFCFSSAHAATARDRGVRLATVGLDRMFLIESASKAVSDFRATLTGDLTGDQS